MLLAATALHAADAAHPPAARPRLTQELRQRAESIGGAHGSAMGGNNDLVTLAPLEVTQAYHPKPQRDVVTEHPFTWTKGGTFLRRDGSRFTTLLKFQANPNDDGSIILNSMPNDPGFNILSILW